MSAIAEKQTFRLRANDFQGYQAPTNAWGGVIWCSEYRNENCLASIHMHEPRGLGTDQPCAKRASDLHLVAFRARRRRYVASYYPTHVTNYILKHGLSVLTRLGVHTDAYGCKVGTGENDEL